jgi:hypothetical protein
MDLHTAFFNHLEGVANDALTSAAACEEHAQKFELDGLSGVVLDGDMDAETLIVKASFQNLKGSVSAGLRALTAAKRNFLIKSIVEDIVELAKRKAATGHDSVTLTPPYAEIKTYHHTEMAPLKLMPSVVSALQEIGLKVAYHNPNLVEPALREMRSGVAYYKPNLAQPKMPSRYEQLVVSWIDGELNQYQLVVSLTGQYRAAKSTNYNYIDVSRLSRTAVRGPAFVGSPRPPHAT